MANITKIKVGSTSYTVYPGTTVAVAQGGTGQTTLAAARNAMGLGNTTGAVPIANGGTGATTAAAARTNLGMSDYISGKSIQSGTAAAGTVYWMKFGSGLGICFGFRSQSMSSGNYWGASITLPFGINPAVMMATERNAQVTSIYIDPRDYTDVSGVWYHTSFAVGYRCSQSGTYEYTWLIMGKYKP